jgi:hypothetical protein
MAAPAARGSVLEVGIASTVTAVMSALTATLALELEGPGQPRLAVHIMTNTALTGATHGIAVYRHGDSGKLAFTRVYDDSDLPLPNTPR